MLTEGVTTPHDCTHSNFCQICRIYTTDLNYFEPFFNECMRLQYKCISSLNSMNPAALTWTCKLGIDRPKFLDLMSWCIIEVHKITPFQDVSWL